MGGFGSGRRGSGRVKPVVEHQICIKMSSLKEHPDGTSLCFDWTLSGTHYTAQVDMKKDELQIQMVHQGHATDQIVKLNAMACHLGGFRRWMVCPECERQRTALFLGMQKMMFACRECLGLGYRSQKKVLPERLLHNAEMLRKREKLPPLFHPISRPKGKHASSFERLKERIYGYEIEGCDHFLGWIQSTVSRAAGRTN